MPARRKRLVKIADLAERWRPPCDLDILRREDLETRIDPENLEALIGSLRFLSEETSVVAKETQKSGRPRDLAEEQWILELADIYENAFGVPARVLGGR
jgi:hypothetical protein